MDSVQARVGRHEAPRLSVLLRELERLEIDLAQSAFRDANVDAHSLVFLVVADKVLDSCADSISLQTLDVRRCKVAGQERVLRERLVGLVTRWLVVLQQSGCTKDEHTLPLSGLRWMLIVGPRTRELPFALASRARTAPMRCSASGSKVAPRAVAHGMHWAGVGRKCELPRTPFGPSLILMRGTPTRSIGTVVHLRETRSACSSLREKKGNSPVGSR